MLVCHQVCAASTFLEVGSEGRALQSSPPKEVSMQFFGKALHRMGEEMKSKPNLLIRFRDCCFAASKISLVASRSSRTHPKGGKSSLQESRCCSAFASPSRKASRALGQAPLMK